MPLSIASCSSGEGRAEQRGACRVRPQAGEASDLQQRDLLQPDARVVDRGEAVVRERRERELERLDVLRLGGPRDVGGHERHRGVGEDARRRARRRVAHDAPALRVGGGQRRHQPQRRAISPRGVAVDAPEPDRGGGEGAVEVGACREDLAGEALLVPAKALQPRARWHRVLGHVLLQDLDHLRRRAAVVQLRPSKLEAAIQQVQMRVDQARYDDRTLQVDDGSRWAANRTHLLEASDLEELAVSHAPRLSGGSRGHRVHRRGVEEELGDAGRRREA